MAFDMDEAGQNAARRGIAIALREGMNVRVIRLPADAGKDPDECLKKNPQAWFNAVEKAQDIMEWYFEKAFTNKDLHNHKHKQIIVNELMPDIALIQYAVERDHWLKELGSRLGVEVGVLREDLLRISQKSAKSIKSESPVDQPPKSEVKTKLGMLVEAYLALLLKFPELLSNIDETLQSIFSTTDWAGLYESVKKQYNKGNKTDIINQEKINILVLQGEWQFSDLDLEEARKEAEKLTTAIKEEGKREQRRKLQVEIEKAEKSGDRELVKKLLQELIN
jgi:DNA primase